MKNILLLASSSQSRKKLLDDCRIPFVVITQTANENECDSTLPLEQLVERIALYKMQHVVMPHDLPENTVCFVLTADTLAQDSQGTIQKKPVDRTDALYKLKAARNGCRLSTAFCIEKRIIQKEGCKTVERMHKTVSATYNFIVPDTEIDYYLDNSWGLNASGAIAVEEFGLQYLQSMSGSYSTIVGLPLFEVKEALVHMGFFKNS